MKSIRIKGLRSLVDTGTVNLKPINVFVGNNSSGKSSLLRIFPLLKQSVSVKTRGPILWNGDLVDFESFGTSIHKSRTTSNEEIEFSFELSMNKDFSRYQSDKEKADVFVSISVSRGKGNNVCYTSKYTIRLTNGHRIGFKLTEDGKLYEISSNYITWDLSSTNLKSQVVETDSLLPIFDYDQHYFFVDPEENSVTSEIFGFIKGMIRDISGSSSANKIRWMTLRVVSAGNQPHVELINLLRSLPSTKKWRSTVGSWDVNDEKFLLLASLVDLFLVVSRSAYINTILASSFLGVRYIAPLRTSTERYYRYQDLNVDSINHDGGNVGMFISNIPRRWRKRLNEWTEDNFNFLIKETVTSGHVSINIENASCGMPDNITDMGFGYSQILPIIVQLWSISSGYDRKEMVSTRNDIVVAIEQPELHLHPQMQSMLAVVFSNSIQLAKQNGIDLKIVIETHSPSILSKLGDMIAMEQLDDSDVSVAIFEQDRETRSTRIRYSTFNEDGELENWPKGFFAY